MPLGWERVSLDWRKIYQNIFGGTPNAISNTPCTHIPETIADLPKPIIYSICKTLDSILENYNWWAVVRLEEYNKAHKSQGTIFLDIWDDKKYYYDLRLPPDFSVKIGRWRNGHHYYDPPSNISIRLLKAFNRYLNEDLGPE